MIKMKLKDSLAKHKTLKLNYSLPICLGENREGKEQFANLVDMKSILIAEQLALENPFLASIINSLTI